MKLRGILQSILLLTAIEGCVPKPEPSLLGVLVLPLVTQTSDRFFVESSNPSNNQTAVPVSTVLRFTFTQLVDTTTANGNLDWSPSNAITQFTITPNNRDLSLTPNVPFASATLYTVIIKKEIRSTLGLSMDADYQINFTTE
jgi:hypothetical protein